MSDYGYLIQKDNYGKSSNVDKYKKIVENMRTEEPKEITQTEVQKGIEQGANPKDAYKGMLANPNASSTIIAQPQTGEQFLQQLKTKTQMSNERAMPKIQKQYEMQRLEEQKTKLEKEINTQKAYMIANDKAYKDLVSSGLYSNVAQNSLAQKTNAENKVAELQKQLDQINTKLKVNTIDEETKKYTDTNKDTFFGRAETNFDIKTLEQKLAYANNDYLDNPTEENKKIADAYRKAIQEAQENNPNTAGKGGWLDKSLAGYLPQLGNQLKAGGLGGTTGAVVAGGLTAAGTALLPTVGEEVLIPKAAMWGFNLGSAGASAADTYKVMRGMAYQGLLDEGIDEETARLAASDEAFVNAAIEFISNLAGGFILGTGKLAGKGFTTLLSKSGNKVLREAGEKALQKGATEVAKKATVGTIAKNIGKAGAAVVIDAVGEGGEEGTQQVVSIANVDRAAQGKTGKLNLVGEAIKKASNLTDEEKAEVSEATKEGIKIGLMVGGGTKAITGVSNSVIDNHNAKVNQLENDIKEMQATYQTQQAMNAYKKLSPYSKYQPTQVDTNISTKDIKPRRGLPEGGKIYVDENGVAVDSRNYVAPSENNVQNNNYSPVNARQVLVNSQNQLKGLENLISQKNVASESPTNSFQEQGKQTILPTQKIQETVNSAKIAGMSDFDVEKATEIHKMLQSGTKLKFYDSKNVPAGVDSRAANANGFYKDGTLWINKDSKRQVEKILGHELTHHLENTEEYSNFAKTIFDSNLFYDYITSEGFDNVEQFKDNLRRRGYKDHELEYEMVSIFVEDNLFDSQEKINRLARENRTLTQKILNWLSDLRTKLVGSVQEKELLRIENMYRKAIQQANNTNIKTDAKYSVKNVADFNQTEYNNIQEIQLPAKEYGRLAHIVDTDTSIKPGLNYVETSDSTYVIYQKEYNDFKVVGKLEGGGVNDTVTNRNIRGIDETRNAREGLQNTSENIQNERTAENNDELLDRNTRGRNNEVESDNDGVRNKQNVAGKGPAFSLPETDNQGRKLSAEQQEFFKDSKIRDDKGRLIEVYHRTNQDFTEFDRNKIGSATDDGLWGSGFYFSNRDHDFYGKNVIKGYLNITNPLVMRDFKSIKEIADYLDIVERNFFYEPDGLIRVSYNQIGQFTSHVIDKGHDGVVADHGNGVYEYVIFEPNQIKNVDNTNPTENADIRYSIDTKEDNTSNARALSRYAQTLQKKHKDIPEHVNLIQKEIDNGNFMHEVIRDKRSLNYAENYIKDNGFEDAVKHWDELMKRGKAVDKDELALGQTIYNLAVENKDTRLVMKMASDLVQEYTEIGRNLQSATLLRKMTPDGRLYALERSVQKINQDLMQKFDDFENIQIPEELADNLLNSETQKQMDKAVEQIQEYIASQIPATWQEKLNSWRYLSMLGNPRTHIRNIVGNAVFVPAVEIKNKVAQAGELFIPKDQRTKATLTKKDSKLLQYAENDFDNNQETIRGESKYDIKAGIQEKRQIYSTKALEFARKGNFNLLEQEDKLFLKFRYKRAFAGALKARGITIEQLRENSPETVRKVNEIRSYAINEAQKATYRDASIVASMISRGKRKLLNSANQSSGAAKLGYNLAYLGAEGIMPFTKTPINIVKRGIEYSPAGLLNGIKDAVLNVRNGKVTAAQAIDKIAAGTTGTAIAGLGFFLASMGLVNGGEEEKDKEQALKELKGYQNYSLNVDGKSYTIDWTAPSSIPLFIGVELYNSINSGDETAYLNALKNITEPVVEMSMLQGINDTLKTMGEDDAIGNIVAKTLTNYLGQYNPTLLGQIARSFDPVRRTTYVDKNIPVPALVQKFIQQQAAKIPGVSRMLPTYKDQFGQEQITDNVIDRVVQNFLSPGYVKDIKEGTVEKGLTELYEKTGETSVIPSYATKTLTQDKEKINLTAKEYDTYAKTRGELSMKGLEGVFKDKAYQNLTDKQKVDVVKGIYDYANDVAKTKVLKGFELEGNNKKAQELDNKGLDFYKFVMIKKTADTDGNGYTSDKELDKAISKYGATRWKGLIKKKEK